MKTVALIETLDRHDELMGTLHRGRGDKEKRVRGELAKESGVAISYLFRLTHKREEMRDVAGEVYRRIKLTHDRICMRIKAAADRMEQRRHEIEARNERDERVAEALERMVRGAPGAME